MRILVVGATGTIGQAIVAALGNRYDLALASRHRAHEQVDLASPDPAARVAQAYVTSVEGKATGQVLQP